MTHYELHEPDFRSPFMTAAKEFFVLAFWLGSLFGLMVVGHGLMGA